MKASGSLSIIKEYVLFIIIIGIPEARFLSCFDHTTYSYNDYCVHVY